MTSLHYLSTATDYNQRLNYTIQRNMLDEHVCVYAWVPNAFTHRIHRRTQKIENTTNTVKINNSNKWFRINWTRYTCTIKEDTKKTLPFLSFCVNIVCFFLLWFSFSNLFESVIIYIRMFVFDIIIPQSRTTDFKIRARSNRNGFLLFFVCDWCHHHLLLALYIFRL